MNALLRALFVLSLIAGAATGSYAQDDLTTAMQFYRAADYDAALELLASRAESDPVEADRLRALCLLALGRAPDAEALIERVVVARPDYEPSSADSPRVRSAFRAVRMRVLPARARQGYDAGKAAFEQRLFAEAAATFEQTLPLLEILAAEGRMDMEGLRVLATDFLWLSRQLLPKPAEPPPLLPARTVATRPILASAAALRVDASRPGR